MASNYPERISLFELTHMKSVTDLIAIDVEAPRIDGEYSLEKGFNELIPMNPWMILYLSINHVDSCHDFVHGLLN